MIETRLVATTDVEFLWQMVYWAAHVDEDGGVQPDDIRGDPDLAGHVSGWGRDGDLGVIAEIGAVDVGAAWLRLFDPQISDYSVFVDDHTPELVVAVDPKHVGCGIGSILLTALFDHADDRFAAVVLSVRARQSGAATLRAVRIPRDRAHRQPGRDRVRQDGQALVPHGRPLTNHVSRRRCPVKRTPTGPTRRSRSRRRRRRRSS